MTFARGLDLRQLTQALLVEGVRYPVPVLVHETVDGAVRRVVEIFGTVGSVSRGQRISYCTIPFAFLARPPSVDPTPLQSIPLRGGVIELDTLVGGQITDRQRKISSWC
jgi:hypothetical protein